jgi:hypothetical protein
VLLAQHLLVALGAPHVLSLRLCDEIWARRQKKKKINTRVT